MKTELTGRQPHFHPEKRHSNPYRALLYFSLIVGGIWLILQINSGTVEPLFMPTPPPTRTANSFQVEGQATFEAGHIGAAISAYQDALSIDPDNIDLWVELARIQTYSSSLLSTDAERIERLQEALSSIEQAVELDPDDSNVLAIRAFVLNWYASALQGSRLEIDEDPRSLLNEAERDAARAYTLDPNNALGLAFYAEILINQQKWAQAEQYIIQALEIDQNSFDVYRIYGYVYESQGYYRSAIEMYQKAVQISPNLTFLYIRIGRNYLALEAHDTAREYYERAVRINEQLGIQDPVPYIEIARAYTRDGHFFVAILNAEQALRFNPINANTYGQLGSIYTRARNYEDAKPAFRCAIRGCTAEENEVAERVLGNGVDVEGLPLTSLTVAYYYAQYGSVLAALSRPAENYCPEALAVLSEVGAAYPEDEVLQSIIQENQNICSRVGSARSSD
ncbi:MAG: tetratricopeptide repeat protein [Anaerolineales bacterium]